MPAADGSLARMLRWPVKSLAGEEVDAARLGPRGLGGDRTHALLDPRDPRGRPLSARRVPATLAWAAAYPDAPGASLDPASPPAPLVTAPDGRRWRWDDPGLGSALAAELGRPIELRRRPSGQQDRRGTVLVTTEATRRAVAAALGRDLDLRRFRPNLHLELDAPAFAEEGWAGRRMWIGDSVILRVREPCERCAVPTRDPDRARERWPELLRWLFRERDGWFGVIAEVERVGAVERGAAVRVE